MRTKLFWLLIAMSMPVWLPATEPVTHKLFIAGPNFTGIMNEEGQAEWDAGEKGARDGFVLPNGNALIAWSKEVREITRDHQVTFRYSLSKDNSEIGTAVRLDNGNTLITELGNRPRLIEVTAEGKIAVDVALQPETNNAHMQTRMARKLPNGNYLVPHLLAFKVKEYRPDGTIASEIKTDLESLGGRAAENWPFTAIRLANGHTLTTLTHGNKVVEWDSQGQVFWSVSNDDLEGKPLVDPCGAQRLPNGNTVIASYGATQGVKILEVSMDKRMVWKYDGPFRAHELQVLTTNGQALAGQPLK